jgi:hypothetical protein
MNDPKPLHQRRPSPLVAGLLALGLGAGSALAEGTPGLPAAADLLDRAQEASGGDALKKQKNRVQKGTFSIPAQSLTGTFTSWHAPPNKFLNVIEMAMLGEIKQGYDGTTAWSMDPMQGPRLLQGDELEQLLMTADFDSDLKSLLSEVETVGRESFEGSDTWKVRMVLPTGRELHGYFDPESGHMVGMTMSAATPMGEVPVTVVMKDHAEVGSGMTLPKTTVTRMLGMEQVLTIDEVRTDVEDLPSFSPPPQVQALEQPAGAGAQGTR